MKSFAHYLMFHSMFLLPFQGIMAQANQPDQKARLPIDATTKLISYIKVEEAGSATKDSLYNKAMNWCLTYFVNPNDVIREKDIAKGIITCKARFKIMNPADKKGFATEGGSVQYTLKLLLKEGRFKFELAEFNWKQPSYYPCEKWMDTSNQYYKPEFDHYLTQVDEKAKEISNSLLKAMMIKTTVKKDDW